MVTKIKFKHGKPKQVEVDATRASNRMAIYGLSSDSRMKTDDGRFINVGEVVGTGDQGVMTQVPLRDGRFLISSVAVETTNGKVRLLDLIHKQSINGHELGARDIEEISFVWPDSDIVL